MYVAYIDECGCASIAGDAIVCAVAIKEGTKKIIEGIKDSKKLSKKQREEFAPKLEKLLEF
jgi:ribonuclease HII